MCNHVFTRPIWTTRCRVIAWQIMFTWQYNRMCLLCYIWGLGIGKFLIGLKHYMYYFIATCILTKVASDLRAGTENCHILRMGTVVWSNSLVSTGAKAWFIPCTANIIKPDLTRARSKAAEEIDVGWSPVIQLQATSMCIGLQYFKHCTRMWDWGSAPAKLIKAWEAFYSLPKEIESTVIAIITEMKWTVYMIGEQIV